jgi:hypothetical protein
VAGLTEWEDLAVRGAVLTHHEVAEWQRVYCVASFIWEMGKCETAVAYSHERVVRRLRELLPADFVEQVDDLLVLRALAGEDG